MGKRTLNVIEMGYRSALEETNDPVVWLVRTIDRVGAELDVLFRGGAVGYAVSSSGDGGGGPTRSFERQPRALERSIRALIGDGASIYLVLEDAIGCGLAPRDFIPGVKPIPLR